MSTSPNNRCFFLINDYSIENKLTKSFTFNQTDNFVEFLSILKANKIDLDKKEILFEENYQENIIISNQEDLNEILQLNTTKKSENLIFHIKKNFTENFDENLLNLQSVESFYYEISNNKHKNLLNKNQEIISEIQNLIIKNNEILMKLFSEELNIKYEFFAKTFESNISNIYNLIKPIKENKLNNNNFQDKNTKYNSNEKSIFFSDALFLKSTL